MGSALVPECDVRLFDIPNVKGMKYTGRDYCAAQCLKRSLNDFQCMMWFELKDGFGWVNKCQFVSVMWYNSRQAPLSWLLALQKDFEYI